MANSTTVTITKLSADEATDPTLCRVSGYLKDVHGSALVGEKILVRHIYNPMVVGTDTLVLNEYEEFQTDSDGLVQFDVYQGATVYIELPNRQMDLVQEGIVPEQESIDLADLVFPRIVSVAWNDESPYAVEEDEQFTLTLTGTLSNGETLDVSTYCTFEIDDEDVVEQSSGSSTFTAVGVGTANISVTEVDTSSIEVYQDSQGVEIPRLDLPDITLPDDMVVTVT